MNPNHQIFAEMHPNHRVFTEMRPDHRVFTEMRRDAVRSPRRPPQFIMRGPLNNVSR